MEEGGQKAKGTFALQSLNKIDDSREVFGDTIHSQKV